VIHGYNARLDYTSLLANIYTDAASFETTYSKDSNGFCKSNV